jgi:hypothetical protein
MVAEAKPQTVRQTSAEAWRVKAVVRRSDAYRHLAYVVCARKRARTWQSPIMPSPRPLQRAPRMALCTCPPTGAAPQVQ